MMFFPREIFPVLNCWILFLKKMGISKLKWHNSEVAFFVAEAGIDASRNFSRQLVKLAKN